MVMFKLTQLTEGSMLEMMIMGDPSCLVMIGVISALNVSPGTRLIVVSITNPDDVLVAGLVPVADEEPLKGVVAGLAAEEAADEDVSPPVARVTAELDGDTTTTSISIMNVPPEDSPPTTSTTIV